MLHDAVVYGAVRRRLGSVRFAVFWFGAVSFVSKSNTVIFLGGDMSDKKDLAMEILDLIGNQEEDANGELVLSDGDLLDMIYLLCKGVVKGDNSERRRHEGNT